MAVAGVPQDLPLELLARICKDQGHLGVAEVLGRTDVETSPRGDVPPADRLHQAMLQVGACAGETAWGFPIRQPDLLLPAQAIIEGWNRVHNGHGADALLAHVVAANSHLAAQRDLDSRRPRCRRAVPDRSSKPSSPRSSWQAIRHSWPTNSDRPAAGRGTSSGSTLCRIAPRSLRERGRGEALEAGR